MSQVLPSKKFTIPIFVFFSLCGFYFIVLQMALSHAPDRFLEVHKASAVPLSVTSNTQPLLDKILTPLISFFVAAFGDTSSSAYPTVVHFVWSFGCAIQVPLIEAQRIGVDGARGERSLAVKLLAHPMIWGILYQRLSGGWIIPLWLLCFMSSRVRAEGAGMEKFKAESVLAGWWIGHSIPALVMLVPGQPALRKAPLWVAFPILMSVAQRCYLFIRARASCSHASSGSHSGYMPIQLLYLSGFIGAFLAHVHLVIIPGLSSAPCSAPTHEVILNKLLGLMRSLYTFFTPATGLRIPSPAETTAASGVVHFVQFDVIVVFAALWTALVWDLAVRRASSHITKTETCKWVAQVALMLFAGALALSPGAATSLLLMYRESKLKNTRRAAKRKMTGPLDDKCGLASPRTPAGHCTSRPRLVYLDSIPLTDVDVKLQEEECRPLPPAIICMRVLIPSALGICCASNSLYHFLHQVLFPRIRDGRVDCLGPPTNFILTRF